MKKKIVTVFIVAFILHLVALNQSLWLDEGTTARVTSQYSIAQIVTQFSPFDFHPPLYYVSLKAWTYVFGHSEIALRLPSVFFTLISGWIVYLIGMSIKDEECGLWAAIFFLFNPLIMYYSQEARMYMMVVFFLSVAFLSFTHIVKKTYAIRYVLLFNISVFCSFLTFYGSIFLILTLYLYLLLQKRIKELLLLLPGIFIAIVVVFPLLIGQYRHSREALQVVLNWSSVLGKASLKNLLLIPIKFSIGRVSFEPKLVYYLIAFIASASIFFYSSKGFLKKRILLFTFSVPLVLGILFSFFSPLLQYFRFIYLLVPQSIALSLGTSRYPSRFFILIISVVFSGVYLFMPAFHRENWKELAHEMKNKQVVYAIPSSMDALKYYNSSFQIRDLRSIATHTLPSHIVIIPYTAEIFGFNYQDVLQKKQFTRISEHTFRGVTLEQWDKL